MIKRGCFTFVQITVMITGVTAPKQKVYLPYLDGTVAMGDLLAVLPIELMLLPRLTSLFLAANEIGVITRKLRFLAPGLWHRRRQEITEL